MKKCRLGLRVLGLPDNPVNCHGAARRKRLPFRGQVFVGNSLWGMQDYLSNHSVWGPQASKSRWKAIGFEQTKTHHLGIAPA